MKNPFDYFDKIYCVCAKHETERWAHAVIQFEKVGILDRVEKFDEVIDLDWVNSEYGEGWNRTDYCHFKIIMDAHKQGLENVFIFESDIDFINTDLELMSKSIETLTPIDWKLFYMGGIPHMVYGVENEHLINASMCQAHAYAINGKHCKEVAKILKNNKMPIDQVYKRGRKFGLSFGSYATHPRFVVQEDPDLLTRKQVSNIMWEKAVEPMIDMFNKNIEFIIGSCSTEGKLHRVITSNCKQSLDNVGINASTGFVKIHELESTDSYERLELIHGVLRKGKVCFYSDPDNIFLRNPLDDLFGMLDEYDLIIQSTSDGVLNPGFCVVKPNSMNLKLFDASDSANFSPTYKCERSVEYFNDRLNSSEEYRDNIKIKTLDPTEFCTYTYYEENLDETEPYIVNYNLDFKDDVHPRTKLKEIRRLEHYFLQDD